MMRQPLTVLVVLAVVAGTVLPAVAAVQVGQGAQDLASPSADSVATANESDNTTPGQQLSGVVGVGAAEIDGELGERSLSERLNRSGTNDSRAKVVAERVDELRDRLERLQERRQALIEVRNNGTITQGEFRARMAELAANVSATERVLNATADAAGGLPEETLEDNGVNVSSIQELRRNASELTGPEVSEIARSIAGNGAGDGMTGPPDFAGPPNGTPGPPNGTPGNGTPGAPNGTPGAPNGTPGGPNGTPGAPNGTPSETPGDDNESDETGTPGGPPDGTPADGNETDAPNGTDGDTPGDGDDGDAPGDGNDGDAPGDGDDGDAPGDGEDGDTPGDGEDGDPGGGGDNSGGDDGDNPGGGGDGDGGGPPS